MQLKTFSEKMLINAELKLNKKLNVSLTIILVISLTLCMSTIITAYNLIVDLSAIDKDTFRQITYAATIIVFFIILMAGMAIKSIVFANFYGQMKMVAMLRLLGFTQK